MITVIHDKLILEGKLYTDQSMYLMMENVPISVETMLIDFADPIISLEEHAKSEKKYRITIEEIE